MKTIQPLDQRSHSDKKLSDHEQLQITKIHQAIAMIQFKLEIPIIKRRPYFNMSERLLLEKIDYDKNEITITWENVPTGKYLLCNR